MWKIYKITNKTYNEKAKCYKSYIGITQKTIEERFRRHCKKDNCKTFHAAIKKYGKDNWTFEILEDNIKTENEALEKEAFYIRKYETLRGRKGYNIKASSCPRKIINDKLFCSKCNIDKSIDYFHKNKLNTCGYATICKDCKKEYNLENKERDKKTSKEYLIRNKEILKQKRKENQPKRSEHSKEYRKANTNKNKQLSTNELMLLTPIKICSKCEIEKSTKEFTRSNEAKDGFKIYCKICKNKQERTRTKKIKEEKTKNTV